MNPEDLRRVPGLPQEWLEHAESDLRLAQLARQDPAIRREQICFHAQQAAEKAIKSVLLRHNVDFPLTHNIEHLLSLAESSGLVLPDEVRPAGMLTPYAVETRYPGSWLGVGDVEVQEAIRVAEQTVAWARKAILESGREKT
jgi:HEPN domain-containing protein